MQQRKDLEAIGNRILNETRTELYLAMRFMGPALDALGYQMDLMTRTLGTDAEVIRFNPQYLIAEFLEHPRRLNRCYMHILIQCLFRHVFARTQYEDEELFHLCADIAAESIVDAMDEPVLAAVERGDLICGICSSQELLNTDREALAVLPLPPLAGCELQAEGEIWGLALLAGENTESAEDFLGEALALPSMPDVLTAAGLLPAWGDSWGGAEDFSAVLETGRICISGEESGYANYGAKFEQSFRAALALLG